MRGLLIKPWHQRHEAAPAHHPVSIYKCTKTLCKECGKPIAPGSVDGVCTVCRIKARTKKRQEEAAAKAKQLREEREAKKAAEEAAKAAEEAGAAVSAET